MEQVAHINALNSGNPGSKGRLAHLAGGFGLPFLIERFFGAASFPGGTNVAHVFPDSGLYSTVFPGIGGMRIK